MTKRGGKAQPGFVKPRSGRILVCSNPACPSPDRKYYATPSRIKIGSSYCSKACANVGLSKPMRSCPSCKERRVKGRSTFCSIKCHHDWLQAGHTIEELLV